jgi:hypothetical protein
MKKHFIVFLFTLILASCGQEKRLEKWRHIEISPLDNSQVVTVITKEKKRYIMNGKYKSIPDDNYLLLDLSKVDQLGDGFSICWDDNGYKWKIASAYARVIENKLDTTKYSYYQPLGDFGQPTSEGYIGKGCGGILIREKKAPNGNLKVKYVVD